MEPRESEFFLSDNQPDLGAKMYIKQPTRYLAHNKDSLRLAALRCKETSLE